MNFFSKLKIFYISLFILMVPVFTFAYLDPSSINVALQALAAAIVGLAGVFVVFKNNIKAFFAKTFGKKDKKVTENKETDSAVSAEEKK